MATTYTTLKSDIQAYTENDAQEFQDSLDRVIENAQLRISREIDLSAFRKYATASLSDSGTSNDRFLAKPTDMVIDRFMFLTVSGEFVPLLGKTPEFMQSYWPNPNLTGVPRFYTDWDDDTFLLAPTPDSAYLATLGYTRRLPFLSASQETNWLTDNAGDCLLYACLIESYKFMKSTEIEADIKSWQEEYNRTKAALQIEEQSRQRREEYRYGEIR